MFFMFFCPLFSSLIQILYIRVRKSRKFSIFCISVYRLKFCTQTKTKRNNWPTLPNVSCCQNFKSKALPMPVLHFFPSFKIGFVANSYREWTQTKVLLFEDHILLQNFPYKQDRKKVSREQKKRVQYHHCPLLPTALDITSPRAIVKIEIFLDEYKKHHLSLTNNALFPCSDALSRIDILSVMTNKPCKN